MTDLFSNHDRAVSITDSLMEMVDLYAQAYAKLGFAPKEFKAVRTALLRVLTEERVAVEALAPATAHAKVAPTVAAASKRTPERSEAATDNQGIHVWSDGGCEPNPGRGGWGAILVNGAVSLEICGGEKQTTNNRMEFMAAIKALELIGDGTIVTVFTDSMLLVKTASVWMHTWQKRGWTRKGDAAIANLDLVKVVAAECKRLKISWKHVKAHSGIVLNERADWLTHKGRQLPSPLAALHRFHLMSRNHIGDRATVAGNFDNLLLGFVDEFTKARLGLHGRNSLHGHVVEIMDPMEILVNLPEKANQSRMLSPTRN